MIVSCACGAVAFTVDGPPADAGWCHCRICQRTSGAPAVPWATVPAAAVRPLRGAPSRFRSSPRAERWFCGACGSPLLFVPDHGRSVDVNVTNLDDPDAWPMQYHVHTASARPWFATADGLPRHADDGPDDPA